MIVTEESLYQHAVQIGPTAGGWLAAIATAIGSAAVLRRRLSTDKKEMTKDRVESQFLENLMAERNAAAQMARDAFAERAADLRIMARLEAVNQQQARDIERLRREFAAFKRLVIRLYPEASKFLPTERDDLDLNLLEGQR